MLPQRTGNYIGTAYHTYLRHNLTFTTYPNVGVQQNKMTGLQNVMLTGLSQVCAVFFRRKCWIMRPWNQDINLLCCRASLHTCFWGDCSACLRFFLGWSDVSERGEQNHPSVHGGNSSHQKSKQFWKGEGTGERDPQQIAFELQTGTWRVCEHDVKRVLLVFGTRVPRLSWSKVYNVTLTDFPDCFPKKKNVWASQKTKQKKILLKRLRKYKNNNSQYLG